MNTQRYWKFLYRDRHSLNYAWFLSKRRELRREAALERKLEAAQRTIEAQAAQLVQAQATLLKIHEQAYRASLVQDRSVGLIKQVCASISVDAKDAAIQASRP